MSKPTRTRTRTRIGLAVFLFASITPAALGDWSTPNEWLEIPIGTSLEVPSGSALDFSQIFGPSNLNNNNPTKQRVKVTRSGRLSLDGSKPNRFFCAPLNFAGPWNGFPDKEKSERLALQLRRHGYNLARLHSVDSALMMDTPVDSPGFAFNAQQRANFRDLLTALKNQGIHWMADVVTSPNAAFGAVGPVRTADDPRFNMKIKVHYEQASRDHWKGMIKNLYKNADVYKGTIFKDRALMGLTFVNELSLQYNLRKNYPGFVKDQLPDPLKAEFIAWAQQSPRNTTIPADQVPTVNESRSPYSALMQQYLSYRESETLKWMRSQVDDGKASTEEPLFTAYNNGKVLQTTASRSLSQLDFVSLHAYHDAPEGAAESLNILNDSSIAEGLSYVHTFALNRIAGKPFVADEYDIPYWNEWRRETGITMPAYAALQGWDGICHFVNPVALKYAIDPESSRTRRIFSYSIGMDPVGRASETLAALLYRRGDVKESANQFYVDMDESYLHNARSGNNTLPASVGRMAFISKLSTRRVAQNPQTPATNVFPLKASNIGNDPGALEANLARLKQVVPANPSTTDFYVSDTAELEFTPLAKSMSVRTKRTEAHVFPEGGLPAWRLGDRLAIETADSGAMIALSSIDAADSKGMGPALASSKRLLLIVSTDALNEDEVFSDDRSMLREQGSIPVRLKPISTRLAIRLTANATYKVYPLRLNGERQKNGNADIVLPLQPLGDRSGFSLSLNTATLPEATTFFEIVRN